MGFRQADTKLVDINIYDKKIKTIEFQTSEIETDDIIGLHSISVDESGGIINFRSSFPVGIELLQTLYFDPRDNKYLKIETEKDIEKIINLVKIRGVLIDCIYVAFPEEDIDINDILYTYDAIIINMMTAQNKIYMAIRYDDKENDTCIFSILCIDADKLKELEHPNENKYEKPIKSIEMKLSEVNNMTVSSIACLIVGILVPLIENQNSQNNYFDSLLGNDIVPDTIDTLISAINVLGRK